MTGFMEAVEWSPCNPQKRKTFPCPVSHFPSGVPDQFDQNQISPPFIAEKLWHFHLSLLKNSGTFTLLLKDTCSLLGAISIGHASSFAALIAVVNFWSTFE